MKPWMLKETFHELDQSSPSVGFRVDRFSLSVITEGDMGKIKVHFYTRISFVSLFASAILAVTMEVFRCLFEADFYVYFPIFCAIFFIVFTC